MIASTRAAGAAPSVPGSLLPTLLSSVAEGIVVVDRTLRTQVWNRFLEELTGIPAAEVVGRPALEPFPRLRRQGVEALLARALAGETVRFPDTPYRVRRTGRKGWVTGQYSPHRDAAGEIVGVVGILHDITDRKRAEHTLLRSEDRFRALFQGAGVGIAMVDPEGRIVGGNPALGAMLGWSAEELRGTRLPALAHPKDWPVAGHSFRELVEGARGRFQREMRLRRRDGMPVWVRLTATVMRGGDPLGWLSVGMVEDISERKRAAEENVRLAAFLRESPSPVLECDDAGAVLYENPATARIRAELGGAGLAEILPPAHPQLVRSALSTGQTFRSVEVEVGERIFSWTYHPHPPLGVVHLFADDITGRRAVEEQLRHEALHDALTGLPNRLLFMERLARALLHARRRQDYQFAVLFLDLDRFKVVNDGLGHHVGDDLLVAVAARLQGCMREGDTVSRFGGDEFAVLMDGISGVEAAIKAAERIQAAIAAPVLLGGYEVFTSASIGVALSSAAYGRPEYLLRNADMAMYRAKSGGMGRCELFDRAMHATALLRLQTETDLRRALEREELRVFYQPIVCMETGRISGMEALVRWMHPDRGWIFPLDFVPAAEETGMIHVLGRWVLREATRQMREWQDAIPGRRLSVSVNLSVKQFAQADLVEQVSAALADADLDPRRLKLEVTESFIVDNLEAAAATLGRLKALGIQVYMDDFGTGYSSLASLHRLPIDALKVDRSFVSRMVAEGDAALLVRTIAALARNLDLTIVAEGVETREQLDELRALGCELAQGYLFSPPLDAAAMAELLARDPVW